MSVDAAVGQVRMRVARSDRLFLNSQSLVFTAGVAQPEAVKPGPVQALLDAGELRVLGVNESGVISMELSEEAFRLGVVGLRRQKLPSRRVEAAHALSVAPSGPRSEDSRVGEEQLLGIIGLPFTTSLVSKLATSTGEALRRYRENPAFVGTMARTPGHLLPLKAKDLSETVIDTMSWFEPSDISVLINIPNGTFSFGVQAHELWLGAPDRRIVEFLDETMQQVGRRASGSLSKQVAALIEEPVLRDAPSHVDSWDTSVQEKLASPGVSPDEEEGE